MTEALPPTPARADRTWLYLAVGCLALWALYLGFLGPRVPGGDEPQLEGTGLAQPAEFGWRLLDLDGHPVELSRFRGKPIFLNIWATWCPPCVAEMPSIARLASDPRLKDVAFVCVSTDDDPATVQRFLKSRGQGWPMTVLRATDVPPVFATDGIPATFLIAPDGRVAASQVGSAKWDDPKVVEFLRKLTEGKGGAATEAKGQG
jgi:thiol-disulfide isomerase/thioredoxin